MMSEGPLPGVTYDETIYYLKFVDGKLSEVKIVLPGEEDPFKEVAIVKEDKIKDYGNVEIPYDEDADEFIYPIDNIAKGLEKEGKKAIENTSEKFAALEENKAGEKLNFKNEFELPEKEIEVGGNKELTGKDLTDGEFEFVIKDKEGNIIGTATNYKDGNIIFDKIKVDHEGEFEYTIEEVKGSNPNIVYDGQVYKAVIKVRFDRLTNTFVTKLVYINEAGEELSENELPKFINDYTPPTTPPVDPPTEPPTTPPVTPPTPEEPPVVPPTPEVPEIPEIPETPEEPEVPEVPETPEEPKVPQLPKTGIAGMTVFTASGMSLLLAGAWMMRKKK